MATSLLYTKFVARQMGAAAANPVVDLDADTIKIALVNSTYTAVADAVKHTHEYWSDVVANEVTGTGYTAGGATLSGKASGSSGTTYTFDAADVSWPNSTVTATGAVIYKSSGVATTSPLIAYLDFGGSVSTSNTTLQLPFAAGGIFTI